MDAPAESLWPQLTLIAAVAASHMTMPNHWLPYSLVARAHAWSLRTVLLLTFLGALGHVTTTVIVCATISGLGGALMSHDAYTNLSALVLLVLAAYYLYSYAVRRDRTPCCEPATGASTATLPKPSTAGGPGATVMSTAESNAVQRTAALSLVALTTLSPCVGSMPVVLTVLSPPVRFATLASVWATLLVCAASVMLPLVALSFLGAASLPLHRVRRHERLILGLALASLALLTVFVLPQMEHHHHHHHGHGAAAEHGAEHDHDHEHGHEHAKQSAFARRDAHGHGAGFDGGIDTARVVRANLPAAGAAKYVDGAPYGANITAAREAERPGAAGGDATLPHDALRMVVAGPNRTDKKKPSIGE